LAVLNELIDETHDLPPLEPPPNGYTVGKEEGDNTVEMEDNCRVPHPFKGVVNPKEKYEVEDVAKEEEVTQAPEPKVNP
jgi:hypothetical protein